MLESGRAGEAGVDAKEAGGGGGVSSLSARQELLLQRFETSRESFSRYYRNSAQDQPYETADYYVRQVGLTMRAEGGGGTAETRLVELQGGGRGASRESHGWRL